jgi:hypothetical protein
MMIFGPPVYGGAKLDQSIHYDFTLHEAVLSYDIPGGVLGIPDQFQRVINYRMDDEQFESDWRRTKRNYYHLNAAVWNYYLRFPLYRLFPSDEIGNIMYNIGINKLPQGLQGKTPMDRLEDYIWKFLEEYLEGPEGINTKVIEEEVQDGVSPVYLPRLLLSKPDELTRVNLANMWINFTLLGNSFNPTVIYYFTPLNDEFALSIEFQPYCNKPLKTRAGKYINQMHEKTMKMIMNSIRLNTD